jgi:hypothetical protein
VVERIVALDNYLDFWNALHRSLLAARFSVIAVR